MGEGNSPKQTKEKQINLKEKQIQISKQIIVLKKRKRNLIV